MMCIIALNFGGPFLILIFPNTLPDVPSNLWSNSWMLPHSKPVQLFSLLLVYIILHIL